MTQELPGPHHNGGTNIDSKPFKLALRMLSKRAAVTGTKGALSSRRRHEASEQMELADLHDVKPDHLKNFIKSRGGQRAVCRLLDEAKPERKARRDAAAKRLRKTPAASKSKTDAKKPAKDPRNKPIKIKGRHRPAAKGRGGV